MRHLLVATLTLAGAACLIWAMDWMQTPRCPHCNTANHCRTCHGIGCTRCHGTGNPPRPHATEGFLILGLALMVAASIIAL